MIGTALINRRAVVEQFLHLFERRVFGKSPGYARSRDPDFRNPHVLFVLI